MFGRDRERTVTGWWWLDFLTKPWWLWRVARAERQLMALIGGGSVAEGRRVVRVELEKQAKWAEAEGLGPSAVRDVGGPMRRVP